MKLIATIGWWIVAAVIVIAIIGSVIVMVAIVGADH